MVTLSTPLFSLGASLLEFASAVGQVVCGLPVCMVSVSGMCGSEDGVLAGSEDGVLGCGDW